MAKPKKTIPWILVLLFLLILAGAYLRLNGLDRPDFWYDESFSFFMAKKPLPDLIDTLYNGGDAHPFLYYSMLHFWIQISEADWWMRLLSAIFGILAIPAIFFLGKKIFDEKIGLMTAALTAVSAGLIYMSREARSHSFVVLLAVFSVYFFFDLLEKTKKSGETLNKTFLAFLAVNLLLVYTHYATFLFVAAEFLVLLLKAKEKRTIIKWGALFSIGALPSVFLFTRQLGIIAPALYHVEGILLGLSEILSTLQTFTNATLATVVIAGIILYLTLAYGLVKKDQKISALFFLFAFPFGIAFFSAILNIGRIFTYRYLVALTVPLYLLLAKGASILSQTKKINQNLATGIFFVIILFSMLVPLNPYRMDDTLPFSTCTNTIEPMRENRAIITVDLIDFMRFGRYFKGPPNEFKVLCFKNDSSDGAIWCQRFLRQLGLDPGQLITREDQIPPEFFLIQQTYREKQPVELFGKELKLAETIPCGDFSFLKYYNPLQQEPQP